jgi:hypothetical protein
MGRGARGRAARTIPPLGRSAATPTAITFTEAEEERNPEYHRPPLARKPPARMPILHWLWFDRCRPERSRSQYCGISKRIGGSRLHGGPGCDGVRRCCSTTCERQSLSRCRGRACSFAGSFSTSSKLNDPTQGCSAVPGCYQAHLTNLCESSPALAIDALLIRTVCRLWEAVSKSSITANTCAADGQGCPRGGS